MRDRELYREVYGYWRARSQADEEAKLMSAARLSSEERWRQFQDLIEFSRSVQPVQSAHERGQKLVALERYYAAVRRLEARRQEHGRPA